MNDEEVDRIVRENWREPPAAPPTLRGDILAMTEPAPRRRWMPPFAFASAALMAVGLAWWVPRQRHAVAMDDDLSILINDEYSTDEDSDADDNDTALFDIAAVAAVDADAKSQ
jgi:hypothetical protein